MSDSVSQREPPPADQLFEPSEFFDESYGARQFVTFIPDSEWRAQRVADQTTEESSDGNRLSLLPMGFPIHIAIDILARELVKRIEEARKHDIPVVPLPISAASEMNLKPGHPRKNLLYAAHPCDPRTYVPAADFHRLTFEHKFAEVLRLLMHLGASNIEVEHVRGWGHDFAGRLSAGIPQAGVEASTDVEARSSSEDRILYHAELDGNDDPALPDDLIWYPHEPTWQSVAEGRLDFGLRDFSLKLQYADDYGVNADLKVDAENAGFELGGSFEKHESTTWSIEGTFGD
ncbi:hypothetical protein GGQ07_001611 [Salinibacter ruber]|jgi:hypothetical protein|uniref:hypothetical protein n=1 Tax=Salinibacter ruber TaxID=146919 RepID=UPI0021680733|nr:hypothetical protein [Salinibacter ruber]MCS4180171.1 hypothetical protein [Salinibacter ruber]